MSTLTRASVAAAAAATASGRASPAATAPATNEDVTTSAAAPVPAGRISTRSAAVGAYASSSSASRTPSTPGRTSQPAAAAAPAPAAAAAASITRPATAMMSKRKRGQPNDGDGSTDGVDAPLADAGRAALVTCTTQPLFYTPLAATGPPHLVRLIKLYTNTPASASASTHAQAGSSTAATAASSSSSVSSYVRASDLCMTFLHSKTSVSNFLVDFNQPYEKCLLRVPGGSSNAAMGVEGGGGGGGRGGNPDVYCLTRKGVQRLALTKKVKTLPHLVRWLKDVLLVLMRPGNEGMPIPMEAMRPASNRSMAADEAAATASAGEDDGSDNAAARAASLLSLPDPSRSQLAAWVSESLALASQTARLEDERQAKMAAVAAALPSHMPGGSSAGRDWGGEGAARFEGKQTRLGVRYQASITPKLTEAQQAADVRTFAGERLVFDPLHPTLMLPPFSPWPRLSPTDPSSRRFQRSLYDKADREQRRARRSDDAPQGAAGGAGVSADGSVLDASHTSSAHIIERQLAAMQQDERDKLETKLLASAFSKAQRTPIKQERGDRDFELCLLSIFVAPGQMYRFFTDPSVGLPDPAEVAESFEVAATTFLSTRDMLSSYTLPRSDKRLRSHDPDSAGHPPSAASAPAAPVTSLASMAAAAAASGATAFPQLDSLSPLGMGPAANVTAAASAPSGTGTGAGTARTPARTGALSQQHVASAGASASVGGWQASGAVMQAPTSASAANGSHLASSNLIAQAASSQSRALQPVKLPPPAGMRAPPPHYPSMQQQVHALSQRPSGVTHFPGAPPSAVLTPSPAGRGSRTGAASPSPSPFSVRMPAARSMRHNSLGLKASATQAPPSLAALTRTTGIVTGAR